MSFVCAQRNSSSRRAFAYRRCYSHDLAKQEETHQAGRPSPSRMRWAAIRSNVRFPGYPCRGRSRSCGRHERQKSKQRMQPGRVGARPSMRQCMPEEDRTHPRRSLPRSISMTRQLFFPPFRAPSASLFRGSMSARFARNGWRHGGLGLPEEWRR